MISELINNESLNFILVGGKGGVGKTTVASALSIIMAEKGKKTLIVSTDPAHSISDSFKQDLGGGEIKRVSGINGELHALELNPKKLSEEYLEILEKGSEDVSEMIKMLSESGGMSNSNELPPGIDEAMAFAKVLELLETNEYDLVIFDTAPTGHTLRLLSLPEFLDSFLGRMIKIRIKLSNMVSAFKSLIGIQQEKDNTLEILQKLKEKVEKGRERLADDKHTRFIATMIPTIMSIAETERLVHSLADYQIPVKDIIINMVSPKNPDCKFCMARYKMQQTNLEYIKEYFSGFDIKEIPLFPYEIRGVEKLKEVGKILLE